MSAPLANAVLEECESTNDLARALGEAGYPAGTWIAARRQTRGRGRSGRSWESREGNLLLSYLARPRAKALWTWVPLAAAVAACEAIEEHVPASGVAIKWPNDLLLPVAGGWAKTGGILCEGVAAGDASFVVIGIGINCAYAPDGLDQPAARVEGVTADDLRESLLPRLDAWIGRLEREGFGRLRDEFRARSAFAEGDPLAWMADGKTEEGAFSGLGDAGELIVRGADGLERRLYSEEVKLLPSRRV